MRSYNFIFIFLKIFLGEGMMGELHSFSKEFLWVDWEKRLFFGGWELSQGNFLGWHGREKFDFFSRWKVGVCFLVF